jgi:hypothetical protein
MAVAVPYPRIFSQELIKASRRALMVNCYFQTLTSGEGEQRSVLLLWEPYELSSSSMRVCIYCNRFDQRIDMEQPCKHGPTRNNRGSCVFCIVRAKQRWNNGVMQTVFKQRLSKHTSA